MRLRSFPPAQAGGLLLALAILSSLNASSVGEENSPSAPRRLDAEELDLLREGDILIQAGEGLIPTVIQTTLQEPLPLTHAAVLVLENGSWHLVQAIDSSLSGRAPVHCASLESLLETTRPESLIVVRPRTSQETMRRFLRAVKELPSRDLRFDRFFDWATDDALYCSELVAKALLQAGMRELEGRLLFRGPVLLFSTFLQRDLFQPVLSRNPAYAVEVSACP